MSERIERKNHESRKRSHRVSFFLCVCLLSSIGLSHPPVKSKGATAPAKPVKQIYSISTRQEFSNRLGAYGVAAYIVTARGSNRGMLITQIKGGLAPRFGLTEGDVLLQLNNRVVQNAQDADRILADTPSGQLRVLFARQGDPYLNCYNPVVSYVNQMPTDTGPDVVPQDARLPTTGERKIQAMMRQPFDAAQLERYMFDLVNADRSANGGRSLELSSSLSNVARAHAQDMVNRRFFDHVNPDGVDPNGRARLAGLGVSIAENISTQYGLSTLTEMVKGCEKSMMAEPPGQMNHRGNILGSWTCVGIGVARGRNGGVVCVQNFCGSSVP